jgi:hypothetical protein
MIVLIWMKIFSNKKRICWLLKFSRVSVEKDGSNKRGTLKAGVERATV